MTSGTVMCVVFHGGTASVFREGFEARLADDLAGRVRIGVVPDRIEGADRATYAEADVIVSTVFNATSPAPTRLRLLHLPAAGTDAIAFERLPPGCLVCKCFGHETAIAEYVMAALLRQVVPLSEADAALRQGRWQYSAATSGRLHGELAEKTIGILGFGHIGRQVAERAKAFGMRIHVCNRTLVAEGGTVDRAWTMDGLAGFWPSADFLVVCLPLASDTEGLVDAAAFAAMRDDAVFVNVGRGAVVDEQALFDALRERRIAGAVIDTWYSYPGSADAICRPGRLPFHELPNVLMTPHMSGWTRGMVRRRQETIAENLSRLAAGRPLLNVVHP